MPRKIVPDLPVGKWIEFKCNGQARQTLVIATSSDSSGLQVALRINGNNWRHVPPELVYPFKSQNGIGFYDAGNPNLMPPQNIEELKLKQLAFTKNLHHVTITLLDINGDEIDIKDAQNALILFDLYRRTPVPENTSNSQYIILRNAYWHDLHNKLTKVSYYEYPQKTI